MKCGSLEFVTTLKPEVSQEIMVTIQSTQVNADISLTPKLGGRSLRERKREGVGGGGGGGWGNLPVATVYIKQIYTCT